MSCFLQNLSSNKALFLIDKKFRLISKTLTFWKVSAAKYIGCLSFSHLVYYKKIKQSVSVILLWSSNNTPAWLWSPQEMTAVQDECEMWVMCYDYKWTIIYCDRYVAQKMLPSSRTLMWLYCHNCDIAWMSQKLLSLFSHLFTSTGQVSQERWKIRIL